jgi:tetratricopeptide (TPR) repeat protein
MSDTVTEPIAVPDPAVRVWLHSLAEEPDQAIDRLLMGAVWLGGYASLDAPQAVPQFLPESLAEAFDSALQRWLSARWQRSVLPDGATAKQYAKALADAFGLLQTLSLPRCQAWCRERAHALWGWLGSQPSFPSREPRAAFLRALALVQPQRDLLAFWMALCRQGHKPWVQLALFGLRRMPIDDEGTPPSGLPAVLVSGLIDYGLALARRGDLHKKEWLVELDFLSAVYPMSRERWLSRFRDALALRTESIPLTALRHWLDERLQAANQSAALRSGAVRLTPGYWQEDIQPALDRFDTHGAEARPALRAAIDRRSNYAREAGDSFFLVRTCSRLAEFLLLSPSGAADRPRDAAWALELGQVAASWAPGDHQSWSVVARALDALDDWPRAQAVFWYARRRFPYNPFAHTQLGHALAMRGRVSEGEAVYRAAIRRFPDDPVCWADLGHTLRTAGHPEESLAVYSEAQQRFHTDPVICNALCALLIDLGRADEARDALTWAEQIGTDDDKNQRVLADLRRRLTALTDGRPLPPKRLRPRREQPAGDWAALESAAGIGLRGVDALGQAALWRERALEGDLQRAEAALAQVAEVLRHDSRWLAERGLWLGAHDGWGAAATHFDAAARQRPGDGVLAALRLHALQRRGEPVDWQALRGRFEHLAPLIRVAEDPQARRPADLDAAVASVTENDKVELDKLDDETRQALWVYDTAASPELAGLVRLDFLAAQQLAVI